MAESGFCGGMGWLLRALWRRHGWVFECRGEGSEVGLVVLVGHASKGLGVAPKGSRTLYDSVPDVLSQLIRTALTPKEGCEVIVDDYLAIEARVIACLAGEEWLLDLFARGGDICPVSSFVAGPAECRFWFSIGA